MFSQLRQCVCSIGALGLILAVGVGLGMGQTVTAAPPGSGEAGICDGAICGPSGAFSVISFPTISEITWDAFPTNPARPYTPAPGARAIYVTPGGDDTGAGTADAPLATLNRAVEMAAPGDVIWVADGEYAIGDPELYEGLLLDTPGITLAAEHVGDVVLVPHSGGGDMPAVGIAARADNLVIDGFVIRGFRSVGVQFGRVETPQRGLVLKHLRVENGEEGISCAYGGDGIQPMIDGLLVYDVLLNGITSIAMQCGEGPCINLRFEALWIEMPGLGSGSGADALAVETGENVVVFNADISGAAADGIDLKAERVVVANVVVHDLARNGIKLWHGGDVINALVYNTNADAALVFETGHTYRVLNSIIARHSWGSSAYAMTIAYDSPTEPGSLSILNSVFYQNSGPIWVSPVFALDVQNSVFFGSANGQELIQGELVVGETEAPLSALEEAGRGQHNLGFVDPLFANPDTGDYTWGANSPLWDAGTTAIDALPAFDLYGQPRSAGAGIDLGPWEKR